MTPVYLVFRVADGYWGESKYLHSVHAAKYRAERVRDALKAELIAGGIFYDVIVEERELEY